MTESSSEAKEIHNSWLSLGVLFCRCNQQSYGAFECSRSFYVSHGQIKRSCSTTTADSWEKEIQTYSLTFLGPWGTWRRVEPSSSPSWWRTQTSPKTTSFRRCLQNNAEGTTKSTGLPSQLAIHNKSIRTS